MARIVPVHLGPPAVAALARVLEGEGAAARAPLDPALVVVPGPAAAVAVRRALGARRGGIAGVDVVTLDRLVEQLAAPALARQGKHVATTLELQLAIRAELAERPGRFGAVAAHQTTAERLIQLDHELAGLSALDLDRMGLAGGLGGDAVRVLGGADRRLGAGLTFHRVTDLALSALDDLPLGARGPIVVYLPEPVRPFEGRLLSALAKRADCTILVGLTGHRAVDRRHLDRLAGWGVPVDTTAITGPDVNGDTGPRARLLEVADPDDEVRAALRELAAHASTGVPLTRMALLYTTADPYASLIEDQLALLDLPSSAPGHRPLAVSVAGRSLSRLLALAADEGGPGRQRLITLLAGAPIRAIGGRGAPSGPAPVTLWDGLSRQAGVIDGDDWVPRLEHLSGRLPTDHPHRNAIADLIGFVGALEQRLEAAGRLHRWADWGSWAQHLLAELVVRDHSWPDAELVAFERVDELLGRLRLLDDAGAAPVGRITLDEFAATVMGELERGVIPGRPVGHGLTVAPVGAALGLAFDRVAIVGLADGVFPRSPREDSLLPEQVRAAARGRLLSKADRQPLDVRAVAAAVATATGRALLTTARGDLRSRRSRSWSTLLDFVVAERTVLASHHQGLAGHGRAASLHDAALRILVNHVEAGNPVAQHELARTDPVLAAGLRRDQARHRRALNAHTGLVTVPSGAGDRPTSPTGLETYAACPRRFLYERVLRLGDEERPERVEEITPRERGSLLHRVLERFLGEAIAADAVPDPGVDWAPDEIVRLVEIADEEVAEASGLGLTGGRVRTELLRRALRRELAGFVLQDNTLRAERGARPHGVEVEFGFDEAGPVEVALPGGRRLRLRGSVDRVDITDDGGMLVIDYKGGSSTPFANLDNDPLKGGRRLQLPLYARVLADRLGRRGPRTALYWLTRERTVRDIELTDALEQELDAHVSAALDGIDAGLFPGVPGGQLGWPRLTFENCQWCEYDRICPTDRQREWDAVAGDGQLAPIELLLGRQREDGE